MPRNLDNKDIIEFSISDGFIFGKHLRHLPSILRYEDNALKSMDLSISGLVLIAQSAIYIPLIKTIIEQNYRLLTG